MGRRRRARSARCHRCRSVRRRRVRRRARRVGGNGGVGGNVGAGAGRQQPVRPPDGLGDGAADQPARRGFEAEEGAVALGKLGRRAELRVHEPLHLRELPQPLRRVGAVDRNDARPVVQPAHLALRGAAAHEHPGHHATMVLAVRLLVPRLALRVPQPALRAQHLPAEAALPKVEIHLLERGRARARGDGAALTLLCRLGAEGARARGLEELVPLRAGHGLNVDGWERLG
eukprot:4649740-Prymnesium_polylepis.1